MFGIKYFKGSPTRFQLLYSGSRLREKGSGLTFFYWEPSSTIVSIPLEARDEPFAFALTTKDFQELTIQGQLTYRVAEPEKLAKLVDHTVDQNERYLSEAPTLLNDRIVSAVQLAAKDLVLAFELRDALDKSELLSREALERVQADPYVAMLGLEILSTSIHTVQPNPAMARALEAATRESLQKNADEAMYGRRYAVVEQERLIKENELRTEIAVEEKKRQIRETKIAADIALELSRATFIDQKVQNDRKEADARAYGLEATLKPLRETDWRVLMAAQDGAFDSKTMIALAFREMAENAGKIGELNISPDLLSSLLKTETKR